MEFVELPGVCDESLREAFSNATEKIDLEEIYPGLPDALTLEALTKVYAIEVAKRWLGLEPPEDSPRWFWI